MTFKRSSGILLHPTSLPGPYGVGDLGSQAYRFVDFLADSGCKLWQLLPLGPTGYGDSPYQCFSAFAGNPYLVSPETLLGQGLLQHADLEGMPWWNAQKIDYGALYHWKPGLLDKSYQRFVEKNDPALSAEFAAFCENNAAWLEDYALFMAIKDGNGGAAWNTWPTEQRLRKPSALKKATEDYAEQVTLQKYRQFLFFRQWLELKAYANGRGVQIIGDIPIFVAMDSADVWAHPELFFLDDQCQPTIVAGVPPDYFSATGQLWGNPLYDWKKHLKTGYAWWIERIRATLSLYDIVRIDHFRGFAGYWAIPGDAKTAVDGEWVPGPGESLFNAIRDALGELPIIAEDLGEITPDVVELRDHFNLPGMKILQFGYSGPDNPFLPHLYVPNCVAYTGTHDNDTVIGWYRTAPGYEIDFYHRYMRRDASSLAEDMTRAVWGSVAVFAIAPLQDLMGLDTDARMNFPGKSGGWWSWRMQEGDLSANLMNYLKEINWVYHR